MQKERRISTNSVTNTPVRRRLCDYGDTETVLDENTGSLQGKAANFGPGSVTSHRKKTPALPHCVVEGRYRNPLYY